MGAGPSVLGIVGSFAAGYVLSRVEASDFARNFPLGNIMRFVDLLHDYEKMLLLRMFEPDY